MSLFLALFLGISSSFIYQTSSQLTANSSVGNVSSSSTEVYYIHAIVINVYRENVIVVTNIKGDPSFQMTILPKGKQLEINTSFPASLQKDQRVLIVALDQHRRPIKINGMNSALFYVSKTPVKAPRVFYVEKRPTLENSSKAEPSTKPTTTTQLFLAEFSSSESFIKASSDTSSPYAHPFMATPSIQVISNHNRLTQTFLLPTSFQETILSAEVSFTKTYSTDVLKTKNILTKTHLTKPILTKLSSKEMYKMIVSTKSPSAPTPSSQKVLLLHSDFSSAATSTKGSSSKMFPKEISKSAVAEMTSFSSTKVNRATIFTAEAPTAKLFTIKALSTTIPLSITSLKTSSKTRLFSYKPRLFTKTSLKSSPSLQKVFSSTHVSFVTTRSNDLFSASKESIPGVATISTTTSSSTKEHSFEFCVKFIDKTAWGVFSWPDTKAGSNATVPCPHDENATATRECKYLQYSGQLSWERVDAKHCPYFNETSRKIFELSKQPVNYGNVRTVAQEIQKLSSSPDKLLPQDVSNTATVLENIVVIGQTAHEVSDDIFNTINNILDAKLEVIMQSQEAKNSSSRILQSLTNLLGNLNVNGTGSFGKSLRNFAVGVTGVNSSNFSGVTFSAFVKTQTKNGIISTKLSSNTGTSIGNTTAVYLPQTLFSEKTRVNVPVIQVVSFVVYKKTAFFETIPSTSVSQNPLKGQRGSYIMAANIKDYPVSNLKNPIQLYYPRLNATESIRQTCVFWSLTQQQWSNDGCSFQGFGKEGRIICHCNHLTNFAILIDININEETSDEKTLSIISYIGCSLSLLGMMLTILTVVLFRDLRRTVPLQILLNFCIALSLTLIVFLAAAERTKTSSMTICRTAAIALHYFSLSVFMWMAILAFNMYRLFVQILASHVSRFLFKCCVVAWGVPAVIVSITVGLALDHYGDTKYCRLTGVPFLVAFFVPIAIILVVNLIAFVLIFRSLLTAGNKVTSQHKKDGFQQVRQGAAIMVLLGLTWLFGAFAVKDAKLVFQYLFCIFNSTQGLLVFIFYCVIPATMREKYKNAYKTKTTSRFRDESGRTLMNMETTESYKSATFGRDDKAKSPITLTNVRSRTPELHRLTDSFGHQMETVI